MLAERGARVALVARSEDRLRELASSLPGSLALPTDMSDPDDVREMVAKVHAQYGRVDVLVNNAGRGMGGTVETFDLDAFRAAFELNVVGAAVAMQAAIPLMRFQGGGNIVNVSSGTTKMTIPGVGPYAATKSMLDKLSATARIELARDGIVVSLVHPYITATDFFANAAGGGHRGSGTVPEGADTPEYAAGLILEAIRTGAAEVVAEKVGAATGPR